VPCRNPLHLGRRAVAGSCPSCPGYSGQLVKLTVTHDGFDPGSAVLELVSGGWPQLLSNLKTLLETGETLPAIRP